MRSHHGFTLIEVLISGVLLAILMLAVMGVLTQAQREMSATASQTDVTEKTRAAMELLSREIRESSLDHLVAGGRAVGGTGIITRNYLTFPNEANMAQCSDQFCPWHFVTNLGVEREPNVYLARNVEMESDATPFDPSNASGWLVSTGTTTVGRIWAGVSAGAQCPAGHTYTSTLSSSVDMGAIMFASPRNREGRFVSLEGSNRATDWQALVFVAPYAVGGNVVELRQYVVYIDDLLHDEGLTAWSDTAGIGVVPPPGVESITTVSGGGASGGAFSTNNPVGKPTLLDLLDYDGDGATADGAFDMAGGAADATVERFGVTTSGTQSFLVYVKQGNAGGGTYDLSITIDRRTGDITFAVNHVYGSGGSAPAYAKTVSITGRTPRTIATNLRDIEFATIRNCPFDATNNPTGLVSPEDRNVLRITAFFDKLLNRTIGGAGVSTRAATSQEVVVTRVQPRN